MQGFINHNIKHTSASSINMWAEDPAAWVAKYLLAAKFTFSPAARAGVLAEDAVVAVLAKGMAEEDAVKYAVETFNKVHVFDRSEKTISRGEAIPGMVANALAELKQYGEPEFDENGKQKKIEINCRVDDWSIPVIGYLDFWYPKHGLVIDLKTSARMPSELSVTHQRQHAIYKAAMGNHKVKFLFVTHKKMAIFEPEDTSGTLLQIKSILKRQDRFLRVGDAETIKSIVPVINSYYWTDDTHLRKEIYDF